MTRLASSVVGESSRMMASLLLLVILCLCVCVGVSSISEATTQSSSFLPMPSLVKGEALLSVSKGRMTMI